MPRKQSLSQSMNRIGGLICSTLDFDEIMQRVISEAAQAVGCETAALSLREGHHWVVRYVHGFPQDVIGIRMNDRQEPHAVLAIKTKKPVVIDDAFTDERVNRAHLKKWGVRSVLVVPLVTEDEVIGVLSFNQHRADAPFAEPHVDFASQLASSISLAVRNARLFEDLRVELAEHRDAEHRLQEANERLQAQNEELQAQAEELRAQTEEVTTANEELRESEPALRQSEERYRSLFENMLDGYAYCQMFFDNQGRAADFIYLSVNDAFARLTGSTDVVGKKASQVFPGLREQHPEVLETYGRVATTGRPERFILDFKPLGLWFSISVYSSQRGYFTAVFDNITERKQIENTQSFLLKCGWPSSGEEFFPSLARYLARTLRMDFICIDRLVGDGLSAQTVAVYSDGKFEDNVTYALKDTPCGDVVGKVFCSFPRGVRQLFPNDAVLQDLRAEAYVGATLWSSQGQPIGLIAMVSRQPLANTSLAESLLRLVAVSAAGELERRQAEESVKEDEERLRFVLEACHIGAWDMDIADHTTIRSPEHDRIYGYDGLLPQWTYETFLEHVVPEDRARVDAVYQNAVKTQSRWSFEFRIRRPDGQVRWIWATGDHRRDADGGVRRVAGIVQDVTERVQAQEALRQAHEELQAQSHELTVANEELQVQSRELQASEQRLRMALEGGQMGRWEWDLTTDSMFWCERTYALLGLDAFWKASVETFLDCIHPDDRPGVKELIARAMNEAQDFQAEFRVLRHRKEPHSDSAWLALHAKVIRAEQERPVRTIGVLYDITSRRQMEADLRWLNDKLEEEVRAQTDELRVSVDRLQDEVVRRVLAEGKLRKSSRLLEAFFQHTIAPLAFLDRQFNFVQVNEAYARADGRPPEFFARQNYFSLYPSEENRAIFQQVVRTKRPYQSYAKLFPFFHSPQRGLAYWNWRLTPLLDDTGAVQFIVFSLEDVTERQKAFGELEQRARQLQKLTLELAQAEDRERRRLAEILHDDLQQVLAAAKFHLGLLHHRVRNDAEAKELADHLTGMLREAIEKSRSLSHELSPAVLYQSDLGETFEWLGKQLQAKHGLTVHTEVHGRIDSPSEPIKAFLFRAAQEILFNAIKHAQVKEARLRLQRRRGQLWLTIADRGRGFDPQTLSQTSGFGLFSIRERAELLGGRMKIRSAKGRGAVFLIVVDDGARERGEQRAQDKERIREAVVAPSAIVPRPSDDSRLRILLVDDHKIMRDGLAALIGEQADLQVVGQAGDGRQAVEMARGLGPDVVVMDVAMPTMPGDEAARQIKAILPQTRIVALSMFEEPGVAQRMRDAGAETYLPKTGPSDGLLAAIRGKE